MQKENYEIRKVKILDARHVEDTGTDDTPAYNQYIQLLLQESMTGATFIGQYSAEDWKELNNLDYDLHSKELIEITEWLRNFEDEVEMLVPKHSNKIDKDMLLNTQPESNNQPSYRSKAVPRFKFDKEKIKKA
jgi:hypothetical protein